jgi:hypothetical protein
MSSIPKATPVMLTMEERADLDRSARSTRTERRLRQRARIVVLAADGLQNAANSHQESRSKIAEEADHRPKPNRQLVPHLTGIPVSGGLTATRRLRQPLSRVMACPDCLQRPERDRCGPPPRRVIYCFGRPAAGGFLEQPTQGII